MALTLGSFFVCFCRLFHRQGVLIFVVVVVLGDIYYGSDVGLFSCRLFQR